MKKKKSEKTMLEEKKGNQWPGVWFKCRLYPSPWYHNE
jgi:hypothetical protein